MSDRLTRREALQLLGGLGVSASLAPVIAEAEEQKRRPNILFIMTDDQAVDAIGIAGRYDFLPTPNMDRLAREGATLTNAFVTTSLCSPSRASFLTGCYAHRHGVTENAKRDLPPTIPTFAQLLQKSGYETAYVGKWHMRPLAKPRPGFDYWLSFRGQGKYIDPELNENGRDFVKQGYMTDILTDYAVSWLQRPRSKPFCMCLCHKAVHGPFTPAPRHQDAFADAKLPKPPSFDDTFAGKPKWLRRAFRYGARRQIWLDSEGKPVPESLPPQQWQEQNPTRMDYLRALLAVDEGLGRVLDALEKTGQLDNTFIIFTSDNGFFMGEHRRGDKRLMYEASIRIPMLVRYPSLIRPGSKVDHMVLNVDVAPTMLELAGVSVPQPIQGRSIAPLLRGEKIDWRQSFLYEYFQEAWLPGIPTMVGVRTRRWKYIQYPHLPGEIDELYDLDNDPHELHNLATDKKHAEALAKMKAELARLKKETGYRYEVPRAARRIEVPLELALHYNFAQVEALKVFDASGKGHHGTLHKARIVKDAAGPALALKDDGFVQIKPVPETLDPAQKPLTVCAICTPATADGVAVSFGGQSRGFSLYLRDGRPCFAIRAANDLALVCGPEQLALDKPVHLAGMLTSDARLRLYVNGRRVAERTVADFIPGTPNENLLVGADRDTLVGDYRKPLHFEGLIHEVRLYWGQWDDDAIRRWAQGRPKRS
jgi:N-acetylglucosamine-6-sulfatase